MTDDTFLLASRLGERLRSIGESVTTAESCTGGGVASAITDVPGSSGWFGYGFVTYSNQAKQRLLGVDERLLKRHGAVSEEVVRAMAEGAATKASSRFSVAVSGIAGPGGGTPTKPVGTVWFAWMHPDGTLSECHHISGSRQEVREKAVNIALARLLVLVDRYCTKTQ